MKIPLKANEGYWKVQRRIYRCVLPIGIGVISVAPLALGGHVYFTVLMFLLAVLGTEGIWYLIKWCGSLKGKAKREFMRLCKELARCTVEQDILGEVDVIGKMSVLMEADFTEVHVFLLAKIFLFEPLVDLLYFISTVEACTRTWEVFQLSMQELPPYLSSSESYLRKAAIEQMRRLQEVG